MTLERAKFWRVPEMDLLHATYVTHSFAPHTHDSFVIGMVQRGVERFSHTGALHHASAGDIVLVNPDEVHSGSAGLADGWTYRSFYPDAALVERAAAQIGWRGTPYFEQVIVRDPPLARQLIQTHGTLERSDSQLEREEALLHSIAALVSRHGRLRPVTMSRTCESGATGLARDHLEANFALNTSLETLSSLAGISPFHLTRLFKQRYGLPPHALQTQVRLRHARRKLLEGNNISAVALEVGFSDQSHLTRQFKRVYGVTPAVYARGVMSKNVQDW